MAGANFADRLIAATRRHGVLCVGIDPVSEKIPTLFGPPGPSALESFCQAVLARCSGKVGIVKPQSAFFEAYGAPGALALERVVDAAQRAGLLVILDAKRNDIGNTAQAYARALLGPGAPLPADCLTVNPYLGMDSLEPFFARAHETGCGVAVLVRTSNPGAQDFQELSAAGAPLWLRVAQALAPAMRRLMGGEGWSSLMVVAGATAPGEALAIRNALPDALFLTPGYGAQGATADQALAGYRQGPAGPEGGVVNASRAILYPPGAADAETAAAWEAAIDRAIDTSRLALRTLAPPASGALPMDEAHYPIA
jgi:orotidine-5'-phosphate decarboxylase